MEDLKMLIRLKRIPMWKIAKTIGISESTLYVWMRIENPIHRLKIMEAIKGIKCGDSDEQNDEIN